MLKKLIRPIEWMVILYSCLIQLDIPRTQHNLSKTFHLTVPAFGAVLLVYLEIVFYQVFYRELRIQDRIVHCVLQSCLLENLKMMFIDGNTANATTYADTSVTTGTFSKC